MSDDREFDRALEDELIGLSLPEVEVLEVTPWRTAMTQVVWGIGLTTLKLEVWILSYLMTAAGTLLLYLGFRALRQENKWFRACWLISVYQLAVKFIVLTVNAAQWRWPAFENWRGWYVLAVVPVLQLFCLWKGIRETRRRAGQPDQAGAAGALVLWETVLAALALWGSPWNSVLVWVWVVVYIAILWNLSKLPKLLDGAGYQVRAAPVRLDGWKIWVIWYAGLTVCIAVTAWAFARYPMEWTPVEADEQAGLEEIRADLLGLGFPETVLDDLSAEDLADCAGAVGIDIEYMDESNSAGQGTQRELKLTSVAVVLPDNRWKVFCHFQWLEDPRVRGMEYIQVQTRGVNRDGTIIPEDQFTQEWSGRLLYDREGITYWGDYCRLREEEYAPESFFGTNEKRKVLSAEFSLPRTGNSCRGYVTCLGERNDGDVIFFHAMMNYTHQRGWLNYPAKTAREYRMENFFEPDIIKTVQLRFFVSHR